MDPRDTNRDGLTAGLRGMAARPHCVPVYERERRNVYNANRRRERFICSIQTRMVIDGVWIAGEEFHK